MSNKEVKTWKDVLEEKKCLGCSDRTCLDCFRSENGERVQVDPDKIPATKSPTVTKTNEKQIIR
jgi:hypothetical protein